jgi:hypothetical protein
MEHEDKQPAPPTSEDVELARIKAATTRIIKQEYFRIASEKNIRTDALETAYVLTDLSGVSVNDDGDIVGVSEAIDNLRETKKFLFEWKQPKVIGSPSNFPQPSPETQRRVAFERAKRTGNIGDIIKYSRTKKR